jgi:hypothetical protein
MYNGSFNWLDIDDQFNRHAELLQEAENERIANRLLANRKPYPGIASAVLSWSGRQMVCWGVRLQQRAVRQTQINPSEFCC